MCKLGLEKSLFVFGKSSQVKNIGKVLHVVNLCSVYVCLAEQLYTTYLFKVLLYAPVIEEESSAQVANNGVVEMICSQLESNIKS